MVNEATLLSERPTPELARWRSRAMILAVVGAAAGAYGFMTNHPLFAQSYLIAFMFWIGITVGSLALLMVQYLSGGAWGLFSRRVFEAATRNLWLMAVFFVPIALQLPVLYSWARPEALNDAMIQEKAGYLNQPFFLLRAAIFFLVWMGLAFFLNRWSKEQDDTPARLPGPKDGRMRMLSGPGLVLYMLTVTFMSVDWVMSLDPHFTSTIFGIIFVGGQGLSTLAFTILILSMLSRYRPVSDIATATLFHDLGKLMLAFVMLWAYFNVSQLIIIYQGNLPEEIPWYLVRTNGTWLPIAALVIVGHFVLPFTLLLSRDLKRKASMLAKLAMFVLLMRVVDLIFTIGPIGGQRAETTSLHWLDFALVFAMGGVWLTMFFVNLGGRALVPAHDPYFKEAMAHGGH